MVRESNRKKLNDAVIRHHELQAKLADPAVISDQDQYQKSAKEFAALTPIVIFGSHGNWPIQI